VSVRGLIELNRPDQRNALDGEGWRAIVEGVRRHAEDPSVRVLIVQSRGPVFCAGGDVDWMRRADEPELRVAAEALEAIAGCPKPVVARVHGPAYGGGVGLAAACDLVVAAADVRFTLSEVRIGVAPAMVSRAVIGRVGGARFRAWALTARGITAEEALATGLVDRIAPPDRLDEAVTEVVTALAAGEPEALATVKRLFPNGLETDAAVAELARLRARPEFAEGMAAVREKRPAAWMCKERC
jgi:methylglutaconyl-CoA hydratase